jgi:hypothetical protein
MLSRIMALIRYVAVDTSVEEVLFTFEYEDENGEVSQLPIYKVSLLTCWKLPNTIND